MSDPDASLVGDDSLDRGSWTGINGKGRLGRVEAPKSPPKLEALHRLDATRCSTSAPATTIGRVHNASVNNT